MTLPNSYSAPQITSGDEVSHLLEALGVTLRTVEAPDESVSYAVSWGTMRVLMYLGPLAPRAELAANEFARHCATIFAAYMICLRGGEPVPASIAELFELTNADLEEIRNEKKKIPDYTPTVGKGGAPVISNYAVDMTRVPELRVRRVLSTGTPQNIPVNYDNRDTYWNR